MKISGSIFEFDAHYYNGPFDGMQGVSISWTKNMPPKITFEKLIPGKEIPSKNRPGHKMLQEWGLKTAPNDDRIAIYEMEGNPEDFQDTDETIKYLFKEIITVAEYKRKYQNA